MLDGGADAQRLACQRRFVGVTVAVEVAMLCAGTTGQQDLAAQSLTGTKDPDCSVIGGHPGFLGKLLHGQPIQLNAPQRLPVLGFEGGDELRDTLANYRPQLRIGLRRSCLAGRPLERSRCRSLATVVIDDRVAQQSVKPGDRGFSVAQRLNVLQTPGEGFLENILGEGAVPQAPFEERNKCPMIGHQRLHHSFGHGLRCPAFLRRPGVIRTAHTAHFSAFWNFQQEAPVMRPSILRLHGCRQITKLRSERSPREPERAMVGTVGTPS